jgi:hypothetical protein
VSEDISAEDDWWTDRERVVTFLTQLESRRSAAEQAMWQAPTLTIAAQAFLLAVLTDTKVSDRVLLWILVAGIAACIAAILALVRLRARELLYSEAIGFVCKKAEPRRPDPRPFFLETRQVPPRHRWPFARPIDRPVRWLGGRRLFPTVYLVWILALLLFIVADVIAYRSST